MKNTFTIILLCLSFSCFSQKVSLLLNLKQDSTYYLTTNANTTINQTMNGKMQMSKVYINGKVAHKVTAIKDTVYQMDVWYVNMSMHMEVAGKVIDFDTNGHDLFSTIMGRITNKPFVVEISRAGRVLAVRGLDNVFNAMFDDMPGIDEQNKAQIKAQLLQSYGEKAVRGSFQETFAILPSKPISMGEKWAAANMMEAGMMVKMNTTYSLQSVTDRYYIVHGDASMRSDGDAKYRVANGVPIRMVKVSGTNTADIKFDKETGWVVDSKVSRYVTATVQIQDTPSTPGGMIVPMTVGANITLTSK